VAIYGTYEIWEKHLPFIKSSKVIMEYGEPIIISELSDDEKIQRKGFGFLQVMS